MSRVFKHFNESGKCLICGTNEDRETVLVPIHGTQEDNLVKAEQAHLDCLLGGLVYFPRYGYAMISTRNMEEKDED